MQMLVQHLRVQTLASHLWRVVIVANDGAPPVGALDLPSNMQVVVACDTPGSYAARNAGLATAQGEWLLFTDADCLPPPDWLTAHIKALPAHPALQAGPIEMQLPSAFAPFSRRFWSCYDRLRGIPQARYLSEGFAATANLAVHRSVFDCIGTFDDKRLSGGDAEFCRRATEAGFPLTFAKDAITCHPCRDTWAMLSRKARRIKAGQVLHGPAKTRAFAVLRSLAPPLRQLMRFAKNPAPIRHRVAAGTILFALWGVELIELPRLLALRRPPERR